MKKIRWIKPSDGLRKAGQIEQNDDDVCAAFVKAGMAEYVEDETRTHADELAEDLDRRRRPVEAPAEAKAMHESPVDRSMKPKGAKGK